MEDQLKKVFPGWYYETKTPEYWELKWSDDERGADCCHKHPTKGAAEEQRKKWGIKPKECTITPVPNAKCGDRQGLRI